MNKVLEATGVVKKYNKKEVLSNVSLTIEPNKIYGLLGRNGAGKTTLLSILTAQNTLDAGTVTYGGEPIWENAAALGEICFSRELSATLLMGQNTFRVKDYLRSAAIYYPHWDNEYANRLVKMFDLNPKTKIYKMSKGMMSMVTIIIALASRAPITMLDEPVAGLDVVAREQFYDLLLKDYTETQRTFIVSTHIIEEAATALEDVIIIDKGKILEVCNTEDLVSQFHYLSGREDVLDSVTRSMQVVQSDSFGRGKTVCVREPLSKIQAAIAGKEIDVAPVPLQKVFVALTGAHKEAETK